MLSVGVYDAIAHFHNDEKVALDIMELLKIDTGYYIIKCCRSVNVRRKRSPIYRMSASQKNVRKCYVIPKKSNKTKKKKNETEGTSHEQKSF